MDKIMEKMNTITSPTNWHVWLTYPECMPMDIVLLLDTVAMTLPNTDWSEDRYSAVADFIETATISGLITSIESDKIKYHVANNL